MATFNFNITEVLETQSQKATTVNEALFILDAVAGGYVLGVSSNPPVSAVNGTAWIVSSNGTGEWNTRDTQIAFRVGDAWRYAEAKTGQVFLNSENNSFLKFEGSVWNEILISGTYTAPLTSIFYETTTSVAYTSPANLSVAVPPGVDTVEIKIITPPVAGTYQTAIGINENFFATVSAYSYGRVGIQGLTTSATSNIQSITNDIWVNSNIIVSGRGSVSTINITMPNGLVGMGESTIFVDRNQMIRSSLYYANVSAENLTSINIGAFASGTLPAGTFIRCRRID